jgi:hypothetical protein
VWVYPEGVTIGGTIVHRGDISASASANGTFAAYQWVEQLFLAV